MIHIVLIEPEHPGNIGAIARVMKNFGFSSLILVNPKCDINDQDARNRAKHAQDVLTNTKVVKNWPKLQTLIATTACIGTDYNIPRSPLSPEQTAELIKDIDADIGIVFGREGEGLHNDEILKCDYVMTIPTPPGYGTLNVSHAVAIALYEIFKKSNAENTLNKFKPASEKDKEQIMKLLDPVLDKRKWATKEKKETQKVVWTRMIGKSYLTKREAFALMGFLKKM